MKTIIFTILAILFITLLLVLDYVGEASFTFLLSLTALISIAWQLLPRLIELDIKNLKLVLQEIKQTKEDIYAKEEDLKKVSYMILMILSFSSVSQGRFGSSESIPVHRKWFQLQIDKLVSSLKYSKEERSEITKYINKYNEFDAIAKNCGTLSTDSPNYKKTKKQLENISDEILEMLKSDIEEHA